MADDIRVSLKGARRQLSLRITAVWDAVSDSNVALVKSRLRLLEKSFEALQRLDQSLAELYDADANEESDKLAEKEAEKAFEYADKASTCILEAQTWLQKKDRSDTGPSKAKPDVKLEKLTLPSFNGDILSFQAFWESFNSRVDSNPNLNAIDKFDYLRNCCQGKATDVLESFPRTAAGYDLALTTLKRRFGRLAPVINLRLTKLVELKPLDDHCNTSELRNMLDKMLVHVRSLLSLGLHKKGGSEWIGPLLIARLPPRLRVRWEEACFGTPDHLGGGLCPDLEEFLEFFCKMVEIEEATQLTSTKPKRHDSFSHERKPNLAKPLPRKPLLSSSFNTHVQAASCPVCGESDHTQVCRCPKFSNSSLETRRSFCRQFSLCFNCLGTGHGVSKCMSSSRCRDCRGKHHSLLHGYKPSSRSLPAETPRDTHTETATCASLQSLPKETRVLLQSCSALAYPPHGKPFAIRVLFDSCSTTSFIRETTAQLLNLPTLSSVPLKINTFGCGVVQNTFRVCQADIGPLDGGPTASVDLIATDKLVHPIQGHCVDIQSYPHLKNLKISETYDSDEPLPVDVIIGADHYHLFVTGNRKVGKMNQPVAVDTILGWTLHGPFLSPRSNNSKPVIDFVNFCESSPGCSDNIERLWSLDGIGIPSNPEKPWVQPRWDDERIISALPWKSEEPPVSNREAVKIRQEKIDSRLSSEQNQKRDQYFQELQELQIIESCSEDTTVKTWYLPHHCIWKKKLRVVFDGSFGSPSINDMLLTGPNLLLVIPISLISFRLYELPIVADIEKAFLQVGVEEADRNFLRFIVNGTEFRFCRVPFGLTCSPAILNSSLQLLYDSFENKYPDTVLRLRTSTYVDDVLGSFPDEKTLCKFKEESTGLFKLAGMNLRGWTSSPTKVLGVQYNSDTDQMVLPLTEHQVFSSRKCSRRELLSYSASLFDPLGLALPWTIQLRMLLQSTWKSGLSWDEDFPPEIKKVWLRLLAQAESEKELRFSRCLKFADASTFELHSFCDASQFGFATCTYLVSPNSSVLIYSRGRVTPLKPPLTTPRAELMAALLSARAIKLLQEIPQFRALPIFFWSDSTCVLQWIRAKTLCPRVFVQKRVQEISSVEGQWNYVPSADNPADLASRGVDAEALNRSSFWTNGPPWLSSPDLWPRPPDSLSNLVTVDTFATVASPLDDFEDFYAPLLSRCSSLLRFQRILAWIIRFTQSSRLRPCVQDKFVHSHELQAAFHTAILHEQEMYHPSELTDVRSGKSVSRSSPLVPLKPSWDDTRGLLVTSPRTMEEPKIFLPRESRLTLLVIKQIHEQLAHAGPDRTLAKFQSLYWTPRARTLIKRVLKDCTVCKRFSPPRYAQNEGNLPDFRVNFSHPFQTTGVDHAGPLYLQSGEKVYVLLFTCACTRALHLELVSSLNTEETALAFRRFQARRGCPSQVFSDNAACFKRLSPLVPTSWKFIPERSPTWGGWWERMVQTVKRSLRKVVGRSTLHRTELLTVLLEIEGAVNERPLTYVSDAPGSFSPLRPADFLSLKQPLGAPWVDSTSESLSKRWKHTQKVAADLVKRWYNEYLPTLRQWRYGSTAGIEPNIGDIALLSEGVKGKGSFTLVRILDLHPGKDGFVRVATVLLRGRPTRRLIRMLYPFEC